MADPLCRWSATSPGVRRMPTPIVLPTMTASPKASPSRRRRCPIDERAPPLTPGVEPLLGSCMASHASPPGAPVANLLLPSVEDRQLELTQALGIGDYVDLGDLVARDREAQHHHELSTRSHEQSHGSVDERRPRGTGASLAGPSRHGLGAAAG